MNSPQEFRKPGESRAHRWEAAGLRWLAEAEADGGAPVVAVLDIRDDALILERLEDGHPSAEQARQFGAALARTHGAGADGFGVGPPSWDDDHGFGLQGPAGEQIRLDLAAPGDFDHWGAMFADARLAPLNEHARIPEIDAVCSRLRAGEFSDDAPPARIHGDLWAGNVLWTPRGGVLIDPAAHGGHREDDLAALHLFGAPHLEEIIAGYESVSPLADGWQDRVGLHQLHLLMLHVVLFGGPYREQTRRVASRYT
ncbi:fructosamine kinase family protein [Helcobacillus massiliensis]|uniref:Fructosamine-3-kinase n=1 Tax=Helcobacillus massiliensis TaxID=521392 RepID=A0A839R008_9MICO|nr:fructosamine kinase family protein [Helcobacillus massiliensis]MBB3022997.1 fructosamine-3-kinase [Helcobacillus massiliensis]MCT1558352.1 fructosamine kinase family protein [Helcobacillus massiliensis]MCT2036578.1 fructosamine kinase family protein [Helcobacillus massiliensis]MCT2332319.1 fructosamine kinase family protein [Helcobacillus massiliensis]